MSICALSDKFISFFYKLIIVPPDRRDMHEPLNGIWQFHIKPPSGHTGNNTLEGLSDMSAHVFYFL